jgi:flagellar hook-basal body complex protein FliE
MISPISALGSLGSIGSIAGLPKLPSLIPADAQGGGFGAVLSTALQKVNELEDGANQQVGTLLKGGNTDMSTVMIAVEKADVAFQMMMQVRNKIVNAYQDVEKLQF